jgi:OOP family OmpA-OmpF porin
MNKQKFGSIILLAAVTTSAWASHTASHDDGLFLDAETTRARCGVGNYVFRHLDGECGVTADATNYETDLTPISQSVAVPAPVYDPILFSSGSAELTTAEKERLSQIAKQIAETLIIDSNRKVEVQGNADSVGAHTLNAELSRQRASSVILELKKQGVKQNQISMKAFGETHPVGDNESEDGRAQNRRTDLIIQ